MTQKEFIEKLGSIRRKWTLNATGQIRYETKKRTFCPLTAVAHAMEGEFFSMGEFLDAGKKIGIGKALSQRIVTTADLRTDRDEFNVKLRDAMLAACKLPAAQTLPAKPKPVVETLVSVPPAKAKVAKKAPAKLKAKAKSKKK